MKIAVLLLLFWPCWPLTQSVFYNSYSVMLTLLDTQERLISHIQSYVRFIIDSKKATIVKKFVSRCKKEHELAVWNGERYLGNPINSYTLIMRLTRDLDYIQTILNHTTAGVYKYDKTLICPSEEDVVGVVEGMTRLQLLYDLDVIKLANGTLASNRTFSIKKKAVIEYVTPMTSCACFELGLVEYEANKRSRNIAWMEEALRRYTDDLDCPVTKVDIFDRLSGDTFHMGDVKQSIYWIERRIEANPYDPSTKTYLSTIKMLKAYPDMKNKPKTEPMNKNSTADFNYYPLLCLKPYYSPNASLTCYYAHGPHPFLLIAPLKAERLHHSRNLLMLYDVITDTEIENIITLSRPRLQKAKSRTAQGLSKLEYCVHQVANIQDNESKDITRIAQRISQFSGLDVNKKTSEVFDVANYGLGGYYGPHYDFIRPNRTTKPKGFVPMATTLFFLTDIEEGGATVFTELRLSIQPVRKAVLFWYNLDPWGEDDYETQHAVCPVLRGSRWVMSKWILLSGQELLKPCPTKPPRHTKPHMCSA